MHHNVTSLQQRRNFRDEENENDYRRQRHRSEEGRRVITLVRMPRVVAPLPRG